MQGKVDLRRRFSQAAAIAAVVLCIGALVTGTRSGGNWDVLEILRGMVNVSWYLLWYAGTIILLTGTLLSPSASKRSAFVILGVAAAFSCVYLLISISSIPNWMPTFGTALVRAVYRGSTIMFVISMALVASSRLQHRWRWTRLALMPLMSILILTEAILVPLGLNLQLWDIIGGIGATLGFALLVLTAWCIAFRSGTRHAPPRDSQRLVKLTCPRCTTAQEIRSGYGECTNCRLQISIALEEGVCAGCGYLLRGLVGTVCPECGRPIGMSATRLAEEAPSS